MKKKSLDKKRLILLDTHAILHRAYHALPQFSSSKGEPTGGLYGLVAMLLKIIADLKPDHIVACYDLPDPTYRHEAYEAYKSGRQKADDELVAQIKRSYDIFNSFGIPIYSKAGFEADDMLGTISEELKKNKNLEIIIASGDMDTLQLVDDARVRVYTLRKGINDTILYDEEAVINRFGFPPRLLPDFKGLRGDPSDNIIGIKGIGEKTASTLIQKFGTIENIYKILKKSPGKIKEAGITDRIINLLKEGEEEAIFSKMLATIRKDAPIEFDLPKEEWKSLLKQDEINNLFVDLDFRTLSNRLKEVLNGKKDLKKEDGDLVDQKGLQLGFRDEVSKENFEETAIALWLLNSNISNPTEDDILNFTKTKNFDDARKLILEEIKKRNLSFVYERIELPLVSVIREMEKIGIKIDREYLKKLSKDYHKTLSALEKKIWDLAGEEFNINSPKQMGEILFTKLGLALKNQKKTSTGMKSTRESELEKFKDLHPIISHILEYRELQKLLSTYIDNIPEMLDKDDRLHTSLRQSGTTTGRMSSTNPNVQNIPIKTSLGRAIRHAFIAENNFVLASFDYSQIELRIAAILSGDEKLLEIFRNEEDVHTAVASYVFGVEHQKVDKTMRAKAKVINFGILYGMGVNALRQNLGGTRDEAQEYYNEYFKKFSGLASYLDRVKADAKRKGYTETLFGRRRPLEGMNSSLPYIRAQAERMAINAPIQGTAADIIKLAMVAIAEFIKKENLGAGIRMLLQVHDELLFEIREDLVATLAPKIRNFMEEVMPKEKSRDVVCRANAAYGKSWGEMKEI